MKAEMVNMLNSSMIGGNLVQIDNKNRYHVTDKKGHKKVLTQDEFRKNIEKNADKLQKGEDIKFKKPMTFWQKAGLAILGLGTVAAVIYRKDIASFFKNSRTKEVLTNLVNSDSAAKVKSAAQNAKTKAQEAIKNPKDTLHKIDEAVAKGTEKVINGFAKVIDFFKGFKK